MYSRGNLIPAKITDKNGVTATRWIKRVTTDKTLVASLPAPALTAAINHREEVRALLKDTAAQFMDDHTEFLDKASDETLAYIHETLTAGDKPDYFPCRLSCLMNDNTEDHIVEAYLHLHHVHDNTLDDMDPVDYLRGAIESGTSPLAGYDRHDADRAEAVSNLYRFLCATDSATFTDPHQTNGRTNNGLRAVSYRFKNPVLADYITNHPGQIDGIIAIANAHPEWLQQGTMVHPTEPPKIIQEYLDIATPLQQGVL